MNYAAVETAARHAWPAIEEQQMPYGILRFARVMVRQLDPRRGISLQACRLDRDSWLDKYSAISELAATEQRNHQQLVKRIKQDVFYAVLENDRGMPACCALAIHCKGVIGIYNVATAASCRRQQFASHLISVLLDWGSEIGARYAYLQVEDTNLHAIKLYNKLGFRNFYQYRYRVKRVAGESSWRDGK